MSVAAATVPAAAAADAGGSGSRMAGLASWLGMTLVLILCLNTLGGWVRLSGSGVAIPQWPILTRADGARTLLPPTSESDWQAAYASFAQDQVRLQIMVRQGRLEPAQLGYQPIHLGEFKTMFWTEWSHRLLAAIVGAWVVGLAVIAWRDPHSRRRVGLPLVTAIVLIGLQGAIGGLLVHHGTSTRWLFLHQANAGAIVALILWSLLRLLQISPMPVARHPARILTTIFAVAVWLQLIVGALIAASRHGDSGTFAMAWASAPWMLWIGNAGLNWNLLDNAPLHQWLHGWLVVGLVILAGVIARSIWRHGAGPRLRLAVGLIATFIGIQVMIGFILNGRHDAYTALAHQFAAMCLLCAAVLAVFDARHEAVPAVQSEADNTQLPTEARS